MRARPPTAQLVVLVAAVVDRPCSPPLTALRVARADLAAVAVVVVDAAAIRASVVRVASAVLVTAL